MPQPLLHGVHSLLECVNPACPAHGERRKNRDGDAATSINFRAFERSRGVEYVRITGRPRPPPVTLTGGGGGGARY